ncbi:MAG: rhomboid family intramembrane serine protease [Flavobacteriales bacterium]
MIGGSRWNVMPPVVKNLLIINVLMFFASFTFNETLGIDLWEIFGLHYFESDLFSPYQIVTYMFMHGSVEHIFFNMFAVWMFGSAIENVWGSRRFLIYYLLTGFGAAFLHYAIITYNLYPVTSQLADIILNPSASDIISFAQSHPWQEYLHPQLLGQAQDFVNYTVTQLQMNPNNQVAIESATEFLTEYRTSIVDSQNVVGASGSLFGILLAFGMMFPNVPLFMMFIPIPIKAKYLVTGYGLLELFSAFQNNPGDNVAHFAHLGGMLFGFLIIKFWQKSGMRWR